MAEGEKPPFQLPARTERHDALEELTASVRRLVDFLVRPA